MKPIQALPTSPYVISVLSGSSVPV